MTEKEKEKEKEDEDIHVKFIINKEKTKVLFVEAGSDFTDVLLSFLLLPLGTIVKVLKDIFKQRSPVIGSLVTLYDSVSNLDSIHFLTEDARSFLLNPTSLGGDELLEFGGDFTESTASFVISNDLRVMPIVEGSVISTLSNLGIAMTDLDGAETVDMDFRYSEILYLLALIFISRDPLTAYLALRKRISREARRGNAFTNQIGKKAISTNSKKMILKAMMQKSTNKLLFAQAHQDFVNFLFGALIVPLGRVEWYMQSNCGVRAMDNLHRSIPDSLYNNHLMSPEAKDLLFKPDASGSKELIPLNFDWTENRMYVRGSRMYMVRDDLTVSPLSITSSVSVIKNMKVSMSDVEEVELEVGMEEGLSILRASFTSTTALTDGLINLC